MNNRVLIKYRGRLIATVLFLFFILALRYSGVGSYLTIENFKIHRRAIIALIDNNYWLSVLLFISAYISVVSLYLPVAAILTIVGGFLFGILPGALYADIGAVIGATIAFFVARYLVGHVFQEKFADRLIAFNHEITQHGTWYLLSIHFIPLVPFFIINTLAGLTKVSWWTFVWTTAVGIIPGSLVYAYAGQQLMTIELAKDVFSPGIIAAFLLMSLFSVGSIFFKRFKSR